MKLMLSVLIVIVSSIAFVGCGKKQDATTPAPIDPAVGAMQKTADQATAAMNETVEKATEKVEEIRASAEASIADAKAKAEADDAKAKADAAAAQFDGIVAGIKDSLAANQFDKALAGLKEGLALPNLSAEQKGILQQLQEAIQAAIAKNTAATATQNAQGAATDATKKVDGLLKGFGK